MIDKVPSLLNFTEKDNLPLKFGNILKNVKKEGNPQAGFELVNFPTKCVIFLSTKGVTAMYIKNLDCAS